MDTIRSAQSSKVVGSPALSNKAVGRFSTFVDGTPIVKTAEGPVALIANKKMKAIIAGLRVGDQIEVRGPKKTIADTGALNYSGPAIAATSIKVTHRAPQAEGTFAVYVDGTFIVKTDSGAVGIGAPTAAMKAKLASLKFGDVIEVYGKTTKVPPTSTDSFSGPMIMASEIRVKSTTPPATPRYSGEITHLGAQPGYPSGAFLRLAQPITVNGKSFTMISLPGRFASNIGDKLQVEGPLEISKSPAGVEYLHFTSGPTVIEDLPPRRALGTADEFVP